jgi:hypothetical protein
MAPTTTKDILNALRQKDYHTANEGFDRVMQTKLSERLALEKRTVANGTLKESWDTAGPNGTFTDKVAICPHCKAAYPYTALQMLAHMGSDECPDCGDAVVPTGKTGTFKWNDEENVATLIS